MHFSTADIIIVDLLKSKLMFLSFNMCVGMILAEDKTRRQKVNLFPKKWHTTGIFIDGFFFKYVIRIVCIQVSSRQTGSSCAKHS